MVSPEVTYRRRADVRYRVVGDEAVVVRQEAAEVLALNDVGASVLAHIGDESTFEQIVERLLEEYNAESELLRRDVVAFLEELEGAGVIEKVPRR